VGVWVLGLQRILKQVLSLQVARSVFRQSGCLQPRKIY